MNDENRRFYVYWLPIIWVGGLLISLLEPDPKKLCFYIATYPAILMDKIVYSYDLGQHGLIALRIIIISPLIALFGYYFDRREFHKKHFGIQLFVVAIVSLYASISLKWFWWFFAGISIGIYPIIFLNFVRLTSQKKQYVRAKKTT